MKETEARNKKSTVLVVDDNEFNLRIARDILEKRFSVLTANSGRRTLEILNEFTPSLILLDFHMPENV